MELSAGGLDLGDGFFTVYIIALAISGLAMIVASSGWAGGKAATRLLTGLVGFAMLGYAIYLGFFFTGGTYEVFFYVFVLPFVLIGKLMGERKAKKWQEWEAEKAAAKQQRQLEQQPQAPAQPQAYGQPPAYGQ